MATRPATRPRAHFDTAQAARLVGVPPSNLRRYVRAGLVSATRDPRGRYRFSFVDLVLMRTMRGLLARGVRVRQVARVLASLRRQIGQRPLTRMNVYADGTRVVAWDGATRWQPESGQFLFNFDAGKVVRRAGKVANLPLPEAPAALPRLSAEEWCDLEPTHVTARINLGRVLHAEGKLKGAEAHYREAIKHDPENGLAWFNLGVVLEDTGHPPDALTAYEEAVRTAPELADAHYNLGLLCERMGRHQDALRHLAIFKRLAPGHR